MLLEVIVFMLFTLDSLVECKYCWHTSSYGKRTHFYCGAFEYCCKDKCCENFDEFYKLWYFWLCILIMVTTCAIALYWLRRRYLMNQMCSSSHNASQQTTGSRSSRRARRHRRYRHLRSSGSTSTENTEPVIPTCVILSPPPYAGNNTGCPHPGPPPYSLGSATSINSRTLPRFPPSYSEIVKEAPPSYSAVLELQMPQTEIKKNADNSASS